MKSQYSLNSLLLIIISFLVLINCELEEYFKWKSINYELGENGGNNGNAQQSYIPRNNIPQGISRYRDKIFISVPRRAVGIPSTLNFVYANSPKGSSPSLRPFPNEEINQLHLNLRADSNRIISVYRTRVDECNRLWWIDTGMLQYPNNFTQVQQPSIWIYDLERNVRVNRFEIPMSVVQQGNGLTSVTVDVDSSYCNNAFAYIPDIVNARLYVYSLSQNRIWTYNHDSFRFDPQQIDFNVAGFQYQFRDSIFSITLGNRNPDGYRTVFFHPLASVSEFATSTQFLQNERFARFFFTWNLGSRGSNTQSGMHDFDRQSGIIFYSQVGRNGVGCWNSNAAHSPYNFEMLTSNNDTMIYPSDLKVDCDGNLWMFTNTLPRAIFGQLDLNEYNFRLWRASTNDLVKNSICRYSNWPLRI